MHPDVSNTAFQSAAAFINRTNCNLYLTGKAGTGKTTFLRYIREHTHKKLAIVAPTGVAAINAGGVTIHSFFQIPPGTFLPHGAQLPPSHDELFYNQRTLLRHLRVTREKRALFRELELLIIDEVSMLRADLLDAMDTVLRHLRRRPGLPFGGVQVLFIGDLFQLPPVVKNMEWDLLRPYYDSPFFFDAMVLTRHKPVCIELKKIYRQSDATFIDLLNKIRNNCCSSEDLGMLDKHWKPEFRIPEDQHYITLTTHNARANAINERELRKLPGPEHRFDCVVEGDFQERLFPAEKVLTLKVGAQVMFIRNDTGEDRRFYNGRIGTIHSIDKEGIFVKFPDEEEAFKMPKAEWQNIRYHYDEKNNGIKEEELGVFRQYPIRLAWAVTIHKSQGLSFDRAIVDAGESFAAGQVYVALSRLTNLDGLVLRTRILPRSISTDERVLRFSALAPDDNKLSELLKQEQQEYLRHLLVEGFNLDQELELWRQQMEWLNESQFDDEADWTASIIEKLAELNAVSDKFRSKLTTIIHGHEKESLNERVTAASNYFTQQIESAIMPEIEARVELFNSRKRVKLYLDRLEQLRRSLVWKVYRLKQLKIISPLINSEAEEGELLSALAALQKPADPAAITARLSPPKKTKPQPRPKKGASKLISLEMFREGKPVEEIAKERQLAVSTIQGHLAEYVATGEVPAPDLMKPDKLGAAVELLSKNPGLSLTEMREKLGEVFDFYELRIAKNHFIFQSKGNGGDVNGQESIKTVENSVKGESSGF